MKMFLSVEPGFRYGPVFSVVIIFMTQMNTHKNLSPLLTSCFTKLCKFLVQSADVLDMLMNIHQIPCYNGVTL